MRRSYFCCCIPLSSTLLILLLIQRDMPEEAGEVGLNSDEVMVYTAEESELVSHPFVCIRNLLFVIKEV